MLMQQVFTLKIHFALSIFEWQVTFTKGKADNKSWAQKDLYFHILENQRDE